MQINDEMKKKIITYVIIALITIVFYFIFFHFDSIRAYLDGFFKLLSPFIIGFAFAFLLNEPMDYIEFKLFKNWQIKDKLKHTIAAILALCFGIIVIGLFLLILLPQLFKSVYSLVSVFPGYFDEFEKTVIAFVNDYNIDIKQINEWLNQVNLLDKFSTVFTAFITNVPGLFYGFTKGVMDLIVSIMAAFYMMLEKKRFMRYVKKINYALLPKNFADYLTEKVIVSGQIFNDFIIGKFIDSLIIGILCYVGMLILNLPYALLLAVIVGVTNMIPVFGPFIGAIPGIFILLIIHPLYALYFAIFILLLQQFDGNILGPLILGDRLGIPSLFILFSVCVGGGLFGIIGMFIGVPVFTVFYLIIKEIVNYLLDKKKLDV